MVATSRHRRPLQVYVVGLAFSVLAAVVTALEPGFLQTMETGLLDLHFALRGTPEGERQIAIVTIDDASLTRVGRWPWRRSHFAEIVDILNRYGAKVIAFDIFFQADDRESTSDDSLVLAQAISKAGNVVLPIYFTLDRQEAGAGPPPADGNDFAFPVIRQENRLAEAHLVNGYAVNVNDPLLQRAASASGHINLVPDRDGVARHEVLVLKHASQFIPSFSLRVAQRFLADRQDRFELIGGQGVGVGDREIAIETLPLGGARLWGAKLINWRGGYRSFPYYSAADVLAERFPSDAFRNKIVLVGATAPGLYDAITTPLSRLFPGVEKNATAIDNILANDFIRRPQANDLWAIVLSLGLGLILTAIMPQLGLMAQGLALTIVLVITVGGSQLLFSHNGLCLPLAAPLATIALVSLTLILALFLKTRQEHAEAVEERFETIVELGLAYQQKGLLEMAYQHFAKLPLNEDSCRLLYNLALELQRKRKVDLAITICKRLYAANHAYEDVASRLQEMGVEVVMPPASPEQQGTVTFMQRHEASEDASLLKGGQTLGRYEIQRLLGRGSMGAVYLAQDPTIDRLVAIKTFHLTRLAEAGELMELKTTFLREAKMAGGLNHTNIVTIFDAGEDWDLSYIAMEVLEGEDLRRYCKPGSLLPLAQVVAIVRTVALALDYAHRHGVIHRDVKPANIMLLASGEVKLTDFGIAQACGERARQAGTPAYMAPEQLREGGVIDGRTDLYALGVVFFELLAGRKPFSGANFDKLSQHILRLAAPRIASLVPGIPASIDEAISRLLAKQPVDRFRDGQALAAFLASIPELGETGPPLGGGEGEASPESLEATEIIT